MNKKTILWTISLTILAVAISYGTLYYLKQRDMKLQEEGKQTQQEELDQEKLLQSITPATQDKIFTEEEKNLIESVSPANNATSSQQKTADQETQKLLESITPKK